MGGQGLPRRRSFRALFLEKLEKFLGVGDRRERLMRYAEIIIGTLLIVVPLLAYKPLYIFLTENPPHLITYIASTLTILGIAFYIIDEILRERNRVEAMVKIEEMRLEKRGGKVDLTKDLESQLEEIITIGENSVRKITLSILADTPKGVEANSSSWKIWKINYWIANNIKYVSDPTVMEYFAYPRDTLEAKAGDCDDIAILAATMYETAGLDAAIAFIDTKGDEIMDHAACMVHYPGAVDEFIDEVNSILKRLGLRSPTGTIVVRHYKTSDLRGSMGSYPRGIWILIDPPLSDVKDLPGYITHKSYNVVQMVDIGYKKQRV
ncbi:MAG: transglutaminase-like domain-containing protein [Candidatus Bathyarchaeia archaeon]